ncbi:MAG: penicillin-binding protein 1B [Steroidobacteraceae bacterium]
MAFSFDTYRRLSRAKRIVLGGLGAFVFGVLVYALYLDRLVVHQFEGRRWTLPAQVFAAPLELYAGLGLSAEQIEAELQRLNYRRESQLARPGTFRRRGARFDVALRAARFADEARPAQLLTIMAGASGIEQLRDAGGNELPILRLEPLLIGSIFPIHGEDRIILTPDDVPPLLPAALKAIEDQKFDSHYGVDPGGIARAFLANVKAGQIEQGGSTLTQQLVKSYFLDPRQTLGRKLREAFMALSLEARFSKADLMNSYVNEIYLGQDGERAIHGFGLASQFYFGKPLAELDVPEVALLVALVRGPSYYDPRRKPERARARRDLVLKLLAERDVLSAEEARSAARQPLGVTTRVAGGYYPAYLDFVRRSLRRDYRDEDLTEAGLTIFTSLDPRAQEQAERALERELARLDRARKSDDASLEGAVVVTNPQSGDVIAIVGGRRVGYDGFNRALDARRSIGSLVKPFVYLAALETGRYHAASIVEDGPIEVKLSRDKVWKPENFTHEVYGPVPLVRALSDSLNLATVRLGMDVGVPRVAHLLETFGLEREPQEVPALLLGAVDVTPLEVAQLYNGLANGGFRTQLRAVRAVIDAEGKALKAFPLEVTPIASAEMVYQLDRMLEQVMIRGTGRAARASLPADFVVLGKTGTSSDLRDSWFAGFSGSHLAVVWVGYDDNRPTRFTGSSGALTVWARLMGNVQASSWSAALPESLADVWIEYPTGLAVEPGCVDDTISVAVPKIAQLPYKPGCEPSEGVLDRAGRWLRDIIN